MENYSSVTRLARELLHKPSTPCSSSSRARGGRVAAGELGEGEGEGVADEGWLVGERPLVRSPVVGVLEDGDGPYCP